MKWKRSKKTDNSSGKKAGSDGPAADTSDSSCKSHASRSQAISQQAAAVAAAGGPGREGVAAAAYFAAAAAAGAASSPSSSSVAAAAAVSSRKAEAKVAEARAVSTTATVSWAPARHLAECGRNVLPSVGQHNSISDKQLQEDPFYRPYVS